MNTHDKIVKCRSCGYVGPCDPTCCERPDYDGTTAEEAWQAAIYAVSQPAEPSKGETVLYTSQKALDLASRSDAVVSVGLTRVPQMSWNVPLYTAPQPAEPVNIYVETRECHECGHIGINDAHVSKAACNSCGWTGYTPNVDRCPGCDQAGTMTAACPTCGGRYGLLAEKNITWNSASAAQPAEPADVDHGETRVNIGLKAKTGCDLGGVVDHGEAEPVKVPSDSELEKAWDSFEAEMARHPTDDELEEFMAQFADEMGHIHDDQHAEAARALLARYGKGTP